MSDSRRATGALTAIKQHPQDLTLAVLTASARVPSLTVLADDTRQYHYEGNCWSITYRVIGESHWITVQRDDDVCLHEILACVGVAPEACHHHRTFADLQPHDYNTDGHLAPGCTYQTRIRFCEGDAVPDWERPVNAASLTVTFPAIHGVHPRTDIQWQQRGDTLHWWTLHAYVCDDGNTIDVHTHSTWQFPRETNPQRRPTLDV